MIAGAHRAGRRLRLLAGCFLAASVGVHGRATGPSPLDEEGGTWTTWVLPSGSTLRPPAPAPVTDGSTRLELAEVLSLQASLGLDRLAVIRKWDGPPSVAWNREAVARLEFYWALLPDVRVATPVRSGRVMALLNVALFDAQVAVWDAKYAYRRPPPGESDARGERYVETGGRPGYPSEHAAAAAAAAAVLAYAIPTSDPAELEGLAREAAESRIWAGAAFRSDVEAGWAIGDAVARRVIAWAEQDGAALPWNGSAPQGDQYWQPTPPRRAFPPYDPMAGGWRTWVLSAGDALRPPPPPPFGGAAFQADLDELRVLSTSRTVEQADIARFWATDPPSSRWIDFMLEEIEQRRLSPPFAARALALASVAMYDAYVACWEAKYFYWLVRPITVDTELVTVFSTPPFPSYPSGHSTISAAAAEVFAYLFPDAASRYRARAEEASVSRVWGAVHYRFDTTAGEALGAQVGRLVVERGELDGSAGHQ